MQPVLLDFQTAEFPDPKHGLDEPDGLLAVGGNLLPATILSAYYQGIFPWYNDDDPILWWSPSSRCVIVPSNLHLSKSLKKQIRKKQFTISVNQAFSEVIHACAERKPYEGTWINDEMIEAYSALHHLGRAHSLEVWFEGDLIGGIYGLAIGGIFCGESMFSRAANGSKIALVYLCEHLVKLGFSLLDCQLVNDHLLSMGAQSMDRSDFLAKLYESRDKTIDWLIS